MIMNPPTTTANVLFHHQRWFFAAILGAAIAVLSALTLGQRPPVPRHTIELQMEGASANTPQPAGGCQVDPVHVGYTAAWQNAVEAFVVTAANVSGLDPACAGAQITVTLEGNLGSPLAGGTGSSFDNASTVIVPMGTNPAPQAGSIYLVGVQSTGGFAVPPDCTGMTFQNRITATPGSFTITGTSNADLIYGLSGAYSISGLEGSDCISAYDGNTVSDGNGNDVILASVGNSGSNTVTAGNGTDVVKLGNGTDSVTIGNGTDAIYGGTGSTSITAGNGTDTIYTGGRKPTGPVPTSASPTTIKIGNGSDTIYGGNGNLTVTSGKNGNVTIYLSTGPGLINGGGTNNVCHVPATNTYTITNCNVVHP